jgi:hypothetical protein
MSPLQKKCYVINNVTLDSSKTMLALSEIISTFSVARPLMLVICGPLLSFKNFLGGQNALLMKQSLQNFYNLLTTHERYLRDTYIILVPDVEDLGTTQLPKKPLPDYLFQNFINKFPLFFLAENPFRFGVFGREVVISRVDLLKDFCRKSICPVLQGNDMTSNLVNTIRGQRSLVPLPFRMRQRFVRCDNSINFLKQPEIVVVCDNFSKKFVEGGFCSPGNFANEGGWLEIDLGTGAVVIN